MTGRDIPEDSFLSEAKEYASHDLAELLRSNDVGSFSKVIESDGTPQYRAFVEMMFEPDKNGYLDWEDEYDLTPEEMREECNSKPRTEEEMKRFFANELYEYLINNVEFDSVRVVKK
jgi:hypothetical protein